MEMEGLELSSSHRRGQTVFDVLGNVVENKKKSLYGHQEHYEDAINGLDLIVTDSELQRKKMSRCRSYLGSLEL